VLAFDVPWVAARNVGAVDADEFRDEEEFASVTLPSDVREVLEWPRITGANYTPR
jgi:hypothetical protein